MGQNMEIWRTGWPTPRMPQKKKQVGLEPTQRDEKRSIIKCDSDSSFVIALIHVHIKILYSNTADYCL